MNGPALVRNLSFTKALTDRTAGQRKTLRRDYLEAGGFPVVDQGGDLIAGYTDDDRSVYEGSLPVIIFGDHTRVFKYVDFPFAIGADGTKVLEPSALFEPRYLYYYLLTQEIASRGYSRHFQFLQKMSIRWVPPSEQRRIVEILDQADRVRRLRTEADAKADRILPALFIKMFDVPATNPMGWPVKRFDRICESRLGKMLDRKQQTGQRPRPYLRNANVYWDRLDLNTVLEMDFDESDREEFRLRKGDILICEGGEVGRCAIWNDELPECYFQKALHRVRPYPDAATPEFIVYLFWQLAQFGTLEDTVSKMTFSHLTGIKLKALRIPVPPLALQEKFSIQVRATKKALDQTELARNRIGSLFNGLLHRAFSGALTALWRETHVNELLQEMEQQAKTLPEATS